MVVVGVVTVVGAAVVGSVVVGGDVVVATVELVGTGAAEFVGGDASLVSDTPSPVHAAVTSNRPRAKKGDARPRIDRW
jgi:hypothetical protein